MEVGVVGSGLMGAEIALVFALAGHDVVLNDRDQETLTRATARLARLMDRSVANGAHSSDERDGALGRIRTATDLAGFAEVALVTEAVFETVEAKATVLAALDAVCGPDCIIASNTSTLPISTLAAALPPERRARFLGTHYFSPVSRMKLVEVVSAFETHPDAVAEVEELLRAIGKTPVAIKDAAGFAVNRLLHAVLIEAVKLVEEGVVSPADLDTACRLGLGHPIGPFALMDVVTSDLCLQVQSILNDAYGERFRPPALLKQRVAAGLGGGRGRPGWIADRG
ncbi:MAG: 3-hydroxyacyl-CoA dehydrogenase family protein [Acetobacteraceae bacterium]|nr:3-hydroxyacyl-CoA dehydrogenase family protein [Acetobacteraceae bacterium]